MSVKRSPGWVPNQHGAWAMLIGPFLAGAWLRLDDGLDGSFLIPLLAFWLLGYFAFHAASLWLKAPPGRRAGYRTPLVTYATAAAVAGLGTLAVAGPQLLAWVPAYLPLLGVALWLAWRRNERAVLGGGLTVAAASLMTLVARFASPAELVAAWPSPAGRVVAVALALFGYFFGTVLYVKTMIRERGRPGWLAASIGWHALATAAALVATIATGLTPSWTAFFALTTVRSALMPQLGRVRPVPAKVVGFAEVGFSLLALGCILLTR